MCPIFGTAPNFNIDCIEKIVRRLGRFILNIKKYDSVKFDITSKLKWLFPDNLYKLETLKIVFNIFTGNCPNFFLSYIDFVNINTITTRTNTYVRPIYTGNTELYKRSFLYSAIVLWYSIPLDLRLSSSYNSFKYKVKNLLLNEQLLTCNIPNNEADQLNYSCIERVATGST